MTILQLQRYNCFRGGFLQLLHHNHHLPRNGLPQPHNLQPPHRSRRLQPFSSTSPATLSRKPPGDNPPYTGTPSSSAGTGTGTGKGSRKPTQQGPNTPQEPLPRPTYTPWKISGRSHRYPFSKPHPRNTNNNKPSTIPLKVPKHSAKGAAVVPPGIGIEDTGGGKDGRNIPPPPLKASPDADVLSRPPQAVEMSESAIHPPPPPPPPPPPHLPSSNPGTSQRQPIELKYSAKRKTVERLPHPPPPSPPEIPLPSPNNEERHINTLEASKLSDHIDYDHDYLQTSAEQDTFTEPTTTSNGKHLTTSSTDHTYSHEEITPDNHHDDDDQHISNFYYSSLDPSIADELAADATSTDHTHGHEEVTYDNHHDDDDQHISNFYYSSLDPSIADELAADEAAALEAESGELMALWDAHSGILGPMPEDDYHPDDWLKDMESLKQATSGYYPTVGGVESNSRAFERGETEGTMEQMTGQEEGEEEEIGLEGRVERLYVPPDDVQLEILPEVKVDKETGVLFRDLIGWRRKRSGNSLAVVMGIRIYNPPKLKITNTIEGAGNPYLPITIHFPGGLPIMAGIGEGATPPEKTTPMISRGDHGTAVMLCKEAEQVVFMPFYLPCSKHVQKQYNTAGEMMKIKNQALKDGNKKERDVIPLYPFSPHPVSIHDSLDVFEYIISHLPRLLPDGEAGLPVGTVSRDVTGDYTPPQERGHSAMMARKKAEEALAASPMITRYQIDVTLSGSFVGGGVAAMIGLTEFKHEPFLAGLRVGVVEQGEVEPGMGEMVGNRQMVVQLAGLALVEPMVSWVFPPLGAYDFDPDVDAWILPPLPPLESIRGGGGGQSEDKGTLIPTPTLTELLHLRSHYFSGSTEECADPHASPLLLFQTPGVEVGRASLASLWIEMKAEKARARQLQEGKEKMKALVEEMYGAPDGENRGGSGGYENKNSGSSGIGRKSSGYGKKQKKVGDAVESIITMDGTRRHRAARRWPPPWTKSHLRGNTEVPRGGLPREGRCMILLKEYSSPSSSSSSTGGISPIEMNPTVARLGGNEAPDEVIDDFDEYRRDSPTLMGYQRPDVATLRELRDSMAGGKGTGRWRVRIERTGERDVANGWLGPRAREFGDGVERAWRSVVVKNSIAGAHAGAGEEREVVRKEASVGEEKKMRMEGGWLVRADRKLGMGRLLVVKVAEGKEGNDGVKMMERRAVGDLGRWIRQGFRN